MNEELLSIRVGNLTISVMEELEPIAEIVARELGFSLLFLRVATKDKNEHATRDLSRVFFIASIIRFYMLGRSPHDWLGETEAIREARRLLGMEENAAVVEFPGLK